MPVSKQLHASRHGVRIDHRSLIVMSSVPLSLTAPNYATRPIAAGKLLTEHPSLDEDDSVMSYIISMFVEAISEYFGHLRTSQRRCGTVGLGFRQARHFDEAFHQIPVGSSSVDAQDRNFELL